MFTIGFGDFEPTHTSSRILVFIFTLLAFAALGNQVSIIARFLISRSDARKARWQAAYEEHALQERERERSSGSKGEGGAEAEADLRSEMRFLQQVARKQDMISRMHDTFFSVTGFLTFWVVGAAIFHGLEGWSYGTSVYFTCEFFLFR